MRIRLFTMSALAVFISGSGTTGARAQPSKLLVKPPVVGLTDRHGPPSTDARKAGVTHWVVEVRWADVQPNGPNDFVAPSALDASIKIAGTHHSSILLRIRDGADAPSWAKSLDDPPLQLTMPQNGAAYTMARWWEPRYIKACDDFTQLLARHYDRSPAVGQVTVSCAGTYYTEPMQRATAYRPNSEALSAAGYTEEKDLAAEKAAIDTNSAAWHVTRSELALNPFQTLTDNGHAKLDVSATFQILAYAKHKLGKRFIAANNGLRQDYIDLPAGAPYKTLYNRLAAEAKAGAVVAFQTATLHRVGDLCKALAFAAGPQRATAIELPQGYMHAPGCPTSAFAQIDHLLLSNAHALKLSGQ